MVMVRIFQYEGTYYLQTMDKSAIQKQCVEDTMTGQYQTFITTIYQ